MTRNLTVSKLMKAVILEQPKPPVYGIVLPPDEMKDLLASAIEE